MGMVLFALCAALTLTSALFYYEYYEYASQTAANNEQLKLENGVPRTAVSDCVSTNVYNDHPGNPAFQRLLPNSLRNAGIEGFGLVTYWPYPVNNTSFLAYEVWNVTLITSNTPLTFAHMDMLYIVNCTLS